jgi:butyrate kinase
MLIGKGGMVAYLGTNDFRDISTRAAGGDKMASLVKDAAMYQVAREIGSMAVVFNGKVDAIILTGGLAYEESAVSYIKKMVSFISKVVVYPGEDELRALAFNGLLALKGEVDIREYI